MIIEMSHGDDVSFSSIMYDIFMSKSCKNKTKTIQVVVPVLGSKFEQSENSPVSQLRKTFQNQQEFKKYDKLFKFKSDFEPGDSLASYEKYNYGYNFGNSCSGDFAVYFKILE